VTDIAATIHAVTGRLGQVPIGSVPYVATLPDDYLPAQVVDEGFYGDYVAAGGAGFRSEMAMFYNNTSLTEAVEISELMVMMVDTPDNVVVSWYPGNLSSLGFVTATAGVGVPFADAPQNVPVRSRLMIYEKNTAAAAAGTSLIGRVNLYIAGDWASVPGRFILRGGPGADLPVLGLKAGSDNVPFYYKFRQRVLSKRSL